MEAERSEIVDRGLSKEIHALGQQSRGVDRDRVAHLAPEVEAVWQQSLEAWFGRRVGHLQPRRRNPIG